MKTKTTHRPLSPSFAGWWAPEVVARKMGLDIDQAEAVILACRNHDSLLGALKDLREVSTDAYKAGRVLAEPFVRAGNIIEKAENP